MIEQSDDIFSLAIIHIICHYDIAAFIVDKLIFYKKIRP